MTCPLAARDVSERWCLKSSNVVCVARVLSTHADRQGVDTVYCYCLCVFFFSCFFVRLQISPPSIKLAASNFARRFIDVQGRECPILGTLFPQKPKIGRIDQRVGHLHDVHNDYHLAPEHMHAPYVKSRGVWTLDRHVWIYVRSRRRT